MRGVCLAVVLLGALCTAQEPADQTLLGLAPIQQQEAPLGQANTWGNPELLDLYGPPGQALVAQPAESTLNRVLRAFREEPGSFADKKKLIIEVSINKGFTDVIYGEAITVSGKTQAPVTIPTHVTLTDGVFYVFSKRDCTGQTTDTPPVDKKCKKEPVTKPYDVENVPTTKKKSPDATQEFARATLKGDYYEDKVQLTSDAKSLFEAVRFGVVTSGPVGYEAEPADAYLGLGFVLGDDKGVAPLPFLLGQLADPFVTIHHPKDSGTGKLVIGNKTATACPQKQSPFYGTVKDKDGKNRWVIQAAKTIIAGVTKDNLNVTFDFAVDGIQLPADFITAVNKLKDDKGLVGEQKSVPLFEITIGKEYYTLTPEEISTKEAEKFKVLVEPTDAQYGVDVVLGRAFLKQYCVTLSLEKADSPTIALSEPRTQGSFAPGMSMMAVLLVPLLHLFRL